MKWDDVPTPLRLRIIDAVRSLRSNWYQGIVETTSIGGSTLLLSGASERTGIEPYLLEAAIEKLEALP